MRCAEAECPDVQRIDNLSMLTNLTELWLGKNKISKLEGLSTLVKLKTVRRALVQH